MKQFKNDYKGRHCFPLSAELNAIADFLNNLCAGWGIRITRPDFPSRVAPVVIALDPQAAKGGGGGETKDVTVLSRLVWGYEQTGDYALHAKSVTLTYTDGILTAVGDEVDSVVFDTAKHSEE